MTQHEKFPTKSPISPQFDPWDAWQTRQAKGRYELTSIEFTVTNLCNLRCEHCAVGEALVEKEGSAIPVDILIQRLDEIETLQTISITGGEPIVSPKVVKETIQPLLKYAKSRGIYTQLNSNLTLPLSRYEDWIEDLDVLHISYNYRDVHDFHRIVFANMGREVDLKAAETLFERMKDNSRTLAKAGVFVSGESLLSPFTSEFIDSMHQDLVEMGCVRHEVHPLYPSDFARGADLISLEQYEEAIQRLLAVRNPNTWILFGTLPFFPCSDNQRHRTLYTQLHRTPNVTVRQDPDGRNRLNVNGFTGDVIVTDFGDIPPLGNIYQDRLTDIFDRWLQHPMATKYHCFCEQAKCTGPNILVANAYYEEWDFTKRQAIELVNII